MSAENNPLGIPDYARPKMEDIEKAFPNGIPSIFEQLKADKEKCEMNTERKPIDIFADRLDEIFEMGMPTKALIYDAFHKATETPISPEPIMTREELIERAVKYMDEITIDPIEKSRINALPKREELMADFVLSLNIHSTSVPTDEENFKWFVRGITAGISDTPLEVKNIGEETIKYYRQLFDDLMRNLLTKK